MMKSWRQAETWSQRWVGCGRWLCVALGPLLTGVLFAGGCMTQALGSIQRELEVLLAPEANPLLVRDSVLVDLFGPKILGLFN